jgi:hypothetical protein
MSRKNFNLSLPAWILDDIVGETENRSARIQELLMKGHLYEQDKRTLKKEKKSTPEDVVAVMQPSYKNSTTPFLDRCNEYAI